LSIIGHINDKAAGLNLITRAGQELELKAQGWNALENK
jgi:thiamine-monophosphate kinase